MCTSSTKKEDNDIKYNNIDRIYVTYFCGAIDTDVAIKCEEIAAIQEIHPENDYSTPFTQVVDTFIVDTSAINRIDSLIKLKQPISDFRTDARMYVTIKYKNGNISNICLGNNTTPSIPKAMINNEYYMLENELVYILRYYSGYYKWFKEDQLSYFKELQDTTYIKK